MRKTLLIVAGILVVAAIGLGIWLYYGGPSAKIKNENPIKVAELSSESEETLGTILYPGAKVISELSKTDGVAKATFETDNSLEGVINIYSQDLVNRYPNDSISRQNSRKKDTLNNTAITLTCSTKTAKITVTAWATKEGMTEFEITKEKI